MNIPKDFCLKSYALRCAIEGGQNAILECLLDGGVPFDMQNVEDRSSIHIAIKKHHDAVMAMLVDKGLLYWHDLAKDGGSRLLHRAARRGNSSILQNLLQVGVPANIVEEGSRFTALHEAARSGHSNAIKVLLDHKANIEAGNSTQWTALHLAALYGHVDAVRLLCQRGANIGARASVIYKTPLHEAATCGNVAVIRELVEWGADLNSTNDVGKTPLDFATLYMKKDNQAVLRELGAKTGAELRKT
ncbi:hypothetical protein N7G274_008094 [Stereocaulon virgatum]|uniref:Uncharacterized protein n=1 Tax=Stereocaulon virgatum TaxID=373712 RepID=A0ABR4A1V5_9LECA